MKCCSYIFSLFIETEKARDKRPPLNKPSNPTSKVNLRGNQKQIAQHAKQLFEESSTPTTKATLRRKKKASPEDTAFVNN